MKLFTQNLFDYLKDICRPFLIGGNESRELRIFLSSFPPFVIFETGRQITEYLNKSNKKSPCVIFKTGSRLWDKWEKTDNVQQQLLKDIKSKGWVDIDDRLTHYRNMKWDLSTGKDCLIVILAGVELATDQGSLEDFFLIDSVALWKDRLNKNFKPWLNELLSQKQVEQVEQDIDRMNELLLFLHRQNAGDLIKISDYLDSLDFTGVFDSYEALLLMYNNLAFWNLPIINPNPKKKNWLNYVKASAEFFSYKKYLKESKRKDALKKIGIFKERIENNEYDLKIGNEFKDQDDFISCLQNYITKNNIADRNRLLKFDFRIIQEDILNYKPTPPVDDDDEPKPPKPPKEREVKGSPLEMILEALWLIISDFKKKCLKKGILPGNAIKEIHLKGLIFIRDNASKQEGQNLDLLKGCLGGIDEFLNDYLSSLEMENDGEPIPVVINTQLLDDDLEIKNTNTGNAKFHFEIRLKAKDDLDVKGKFKWVLSDTHSFRSFWNMAHCVLKEMDRLQNEKPGPCLPVFHVQYYNELFSAPDEDEINRILTIGLRNLKINNMLEAEGLNKQDELWLDVESLCASFYNFLNALVSEGYFFALKNNWNNILSRKIKVFMEKLIQQGKLSESQFAPLIYKAFLITAEPSKDYITNFQWESFLKSAIITPLHPALTEMLFHREIFLAQGWIDKVRKAIYDESDTKMPLKDWEEVCDLAEINSPLFGILSNHDQKLETRIESFGMIHRMGDPGASGKTLAAKVLQRYEAPEDEDFSDKKLFRLNRESQLIAHLMEQYVRIYPHANDGLSLAVLNARNVQSVISGIDEFLRKKLKKTDEDIDAYPPYHFKLSIFTRITEGQEISRWLMEWQKRWDPAQGSKQYEYYQNCCISVTQKVVHGNNYEALIVNNDFESDITILSRFINAETRGDKIVEATAYDEPDWDTPLKFPILEMPRCADDRQANKNFRARVISNRRFLIAALHSELSARLKTENIEPEKQHVIISQGDFTPWNKIVDLLHNKSTWVLCLDPCVDERLIGQPENDNKWKREIIGFSSGVGSHGELNYTISTEGASIEQVKDMTQKRLKHIFGWDDDDLRIKAADLLVREVRRLSGMPLVKATTGKDQKIRDIIAFALIRYCLPGVDSDCIVLCDELISLDTFRHWLKNMDEDRTQYPDLMRIVAIIQNNGRIKVDAHLFECKIATDTTRHMEKACIQLKNGLHHLIPLFKPRQSEGENRYDQRYWWSQLQRVIANKAVVNSALQQTATSSLERLGNGEFDITWQAAAVLIKTEDNQDYFSNDETPWIYNEQDIEIEIPVITCDSALIKKISEINSPVQLPLGDNSFFFETMTQRRIDNPVDKAIEQNNQKEQIEEESDLFKNEAEHITDNNDISHKNISTNSIPDRIFLGDTENRREIFWEFGHPGLTNRHLLIFGKSGVGKTYAIQSLLYELGNNNQNTIIIDYTEGFLPNHLENIFKESTNPATFLVRQQPLPINPFRRQVKIIEGFDPLPDNSHTVAGRVTSVFNAVYSTIGEQQRALLTETIAQGIDTFGESFDFKTLLEQLKDQGNIGTALANKIAPLVNENLFSVSEQRTWNTLYDDKKQKVNIMQLAGIARDIARIATEFILWDLYDYATNSGTKNRPLPIVLDEIQNLDHRLESPLGKALTEGRKFGLSLILATQTLSNLKQDEKDRLFQASHKLFFKPAETEVKEYAKILEQAGTEKSDIWVSRLNKLNKGECYSLGPCLNQKSGSLDNRAIKIKIRSFEDRLKREQINE